MADCIRCGKPSSHGTPPNDYYVVICDDCQRETMIDNRGFSMDGRIRQAQYYGIMYRAAQRLACRINHELGDCINDLSFCRSLCPTAMIRLSDQVKSAQEERT